MREALGKFRRRHVRLISALTTPTRLSCAGPKRTASAFDSISDLRRHPELEIGLTHEFLDRQDGWRPLAARYGLTMPNVSGIDHAIGYAALANGSIDVKDAYSTDAKIQENDLVVLRDDLRFFPEYKAVFLYRLGSTRARSARSIISAGSTRRK